jgi:hypothetical protein
MNGIGASILLVLVIWVFTSSRRWAFLGIMVGVLYLTHAQMINIFGFNIFAIRLLGLVGFIRVITKQELSKIHLEAIDKILIILYSYGTLVFLLRSHTGQANTIGMMLDVLFCYFTFRALIQSIDDLRWFLGAFLIFLSPYVALVTLEMYTHKNPFGLIGGLSFVEREGRLRCMGSFKHPSLLGTLGTAFLPLYIALANKPEKSKIALLGIGLCIGLVFLANSGGPLNAAAIAIFGWLLWFVRTYMSLFRKLLVVFLIILAMVMKAPIWYLPAKLSALTGGDGWHRSFLMDIAFKNIEIWWIAGIGIEQTADWFPYVLSTTGGADITNEFIALGLQSGLLTIGIFILLLVKAFQWVGKILRIIQSQKSNSIFDQQMAWGLGCVLAVHVVTWFGITYFDQTYVIWCMQLAGISSIAQFLTDHNKPLVPENAPGILKGKIKYKKYRYRQK